MSKLTDFEITCDFQCHEENPNINGEFGIDFATPVGIGITPFFAGVVTFAGEDPGSVNSIDGSEAKYIVVKQDDGGGNDYYVHLSEITAQVGQHLDPNSDIVGYSGNSGNTSGPHTHFGIKVEGIGYVNPMDKINPPEDKDKTIADLKKQIEDRNQEIVNHENTEKGLNTDITTVNAKLEKAILDKGTLQSQFNELTNNVSSFKSSIWYQFYLLFSKKNESTLDKGSDKV